MGQTWGYGNEYKRGAMVMNKMNINTVPIYM